MSDFSSLGQKCRVCGETKLSTPQFFYTSNTHGRLQTICKVCHNWRSAARKRLKSPPKQLIPAKDRIRQVCVICGVLKDRTHEFFSYANKQTGQLRTQCRGCLGIRDRAQHAALPIGHRHAQRVAWVDKNREKACVYSRNYRKANPEKIGAIAKAWWAANPLAVRAFAAQRRARKKAAGGKYSAADVAMQLTAQEGKCYWCQRAINVSGFHVDHIIPLVKGGSNGPENICCSCPNCNLRKHDKMPHEFAGRLF